MTNFQAIIFDLDDTLYPEKSYVFSGYRAVSQYASNRWGMASAAVYGELRRLFDDGNRAKTFDAWLVAHQLAPTHVSALVEVYRNHAPKIEVYSGIRRLLTTVSAVTRVGLISDGYLNVQRRKFAALNIEPFFDSVVFSDQWGREYWKPAERPYRETLSRLNQQDASQTVYIGDNPTKDFVTARAMGMHTIQLRHPEAEIYHDRQAPTLSHEPNTVVTTVEDLASALR